jgi:hypothetical protein
LLLLSSLPLFALGGISLLWYGCGGDNDQDSYKATTPLCGILGTGGMIALVTAVPFLGILLFCLAIAPLVRHTKDVAKETTLQVQMVCNEAFQDVGIDAFVKPNTSNTATTSPSTVSGSIDCIAFTHDGDRQQQ